MTSIPSPGESARARKGARVAVRLSADAKQLLEEAAELTGRSLSDFVVDSALSEAERRIDAHNRMRLAESDRIAFLSAISSPLAPDPALREAAAQYKKRKR